MGAKPQQVVPDDLHRLASRVVAQAGLELVDLVLRRSGKRQHLRLDIDRAGVPGVGLDDCQRVSQAIGAALDESDLIHASYVLEVSSPGADRPIRSDDDIRRNVGRRIVVLADDPVEGRRSYRGRLLGAEQGRLLLSDEGQPTIRVPLDRIVKAHQELEL